MGGRIRHESMRLVAILQSVLAALFGIQSQRKAQTDFEHHRLGPVLAMGVAVMAGIIGLLAGLAYLGSAR